MMRFMRWLAILVLQASCVAPVAIGAAVTTGYAGGMAAMNRKAGGCIATCTGDLVCNSNTGLCESPRQVCDNSSDHPVCVPQTEKSDVAAQAPGRGPVRILPPPPPLTGDTTRIVTGAEANPPSSSK
jgi:hypothetical protein